MYGSYILYADGGRPSQTLVNVRSTNSWGLTIDCSFREKLLSEACLLFGRCTVGSAPLGPKQTFHVVQPNAPGNRLARISYSLSGIAEQAL